MATKMRNRRNPNQQNEEESQEQRFRVQSFHPSGKEDIRTH